LTPARLFSAAFSSDAAGAELLKSLAKFLATITVIPIIVTPHLIAFEQPKVARPVRNSIRQRSAPVLKEERPFTDPCVHESPMAYELQIAL
jgi:hypothetical protein